MAILPVSLYLVSEVVRMEASGAGFPADRFAIAKSIEAAGRAGAACRGRARRRGSDVLIVHPRVRGRSRARVRRRGDQAREGTEEVTTMSVDPRLFDVYDARMVAGRAFGNADLGTPTAIVNRTFEQEFFPSAMCSASGSHSCGGRRRIPAPSSSRSRLSESYLTFPRSAYPARPVCPISICRRARGAGLGDRVDPLSSGRCRRTLRGGSARSAPRSIRPCRFGRHRARRLLRSQPLVMAVDLVGAHDDHAERGAAVGGRHLCADVVYGGAAHARDRHSHGARR